MDVFVQSFLGAGFGQNPGYEEQGQEVQTDGSLLVSFSYTQEGETVEAATFFEQKGTVVSALTIAALEGKWEDLVDTFNPMVNSYVIDDTAWPY